jgi:hypothetical protein
MFKRRRRKDSNLFRSDKASKMKIKSIKIVMKIAHFKISILENSNKKENT